MNDLVSTATQKGIVVIGVQEQKKMILCCIHRLCNNRESAYDLINIKNAEDRKYTYINYRSYKGYTITSLQESVILVMKLSFMKTSKMTPGIFQGQVWEKTFNPKQAVKAMFYHSKILQQLFPYPNLHSPIVSHLKI